MEKLYLNKEGMERFLSNLKNIFSLKSHSHTKNDITDFPSSLPANGGNSATVNGHTVNSDVPANAKFTDTTYSSKAAASGGTDVSLVTTGEKAAWNAKTSNTGTLTGIKMNGASKGTSGVVDLGTVLTGGKQTTTSTADGGYNIYTFSDNSTITVKNGSKGSAGSNGTSAVWFTGMAVTGTATSATAFTVSGSKAGDMYLNTSTYNVYRASAANSWVYVCNIKGATGAKGSDGTTPTIKASAGSDIGSVGTPSVTTSTSGATTTFTFNNLKGQAGSNGTRGSVINFGTAITGTSTTATIFSSSGLTSSLVNDTYLNTSTFNLYKCTTAGAASIAKWVYVGCIKGDKGANGTNATTTATGTASTAGLTKLYTETGTATDGTMTQNAIKSALDGKASSSHTHTKSQISDFPTSLPASDVSSWAKASTKPSYSWSEITSKPSVPESGDYSSDTIEILLGKIQNTSPKMGSASITKDTRIANMWWNFFYVPHRTGSGVDNGDYGTLLLFPMTGNGTSYIVRAGKGGVVSSISSIITSANIGSQSVTSATKVNGHTVNADVPSGAKFTDTVYTHPTTSGNKHIPSGGSAGQILRWSADGTAVWGNDNNTTYSNFVKSGSGAKAGLVPAPSTTAGTTKYLREDGTWVVPPNTTYSKLSQFTNDKGYICEVVASSEPTSQSVGDHWMQSY